MRSFKSFAVAVAAAVAAVVFSAAFSPVQASLVFIFDESTPGTIVVTGSGSVNTTALGAPNYFFGDDGPYVAGGQVYDASFWIGGSAPSVNAWISELGFEVIQGPAMWHSRAGDVSGPSTGSYMELSTEILPSSIGLSSAYVSGSPLSNTTTLTGYTRADLGYNPSSTWASPALEGTWTLHNLYTGTPTGETITIYSVPEPSTMLMLAGAGVGFGAWRLRKLRRGRPAAGEALAC